ncbi:MAG: FHA domain-containing protein [Planctomycetota bacterium]
MSASFLRVLHLVTQFEEREFIASHPPVLVDPDALAALLPPGGGNLEETTPAWVSPASVLFFPLAEELGDELLIGASPAAEVRVEREGVAVRHATLRRRPGGTWIVEDLRSGRSTSVDGRSLPPSFPMPLTAGAILGLGERVRLQLMAPSELYRQLRAASGVRMPLPEGANLVACCDPLSAVPLPPGVPVVVGRARTCGLALPHPNVSREHCTLTRQGDRVRVVDQGSSNGTWIGPRRVGPDGAWIHPGEVPLTVGPFDVRVLVLDGETDDLTEQLGTQRFSKTQRVEDGGVLSGTLDALPLRQLLQAIEVNQRSGAVHLDEGTVVFAQGRPVWAQRGQTRGEGALLELLALRRGSFRFVPCDDEEEPLPAPSPDALVHSTFTKLLLESTRIEDEGERTPGTRIARR